MYLYVNLFSHPKVFFPTFSFTWVIVLILVSKWRLLICKKIEVENLKKLMTDPGFFILRTDDQMLKGITFVKEGHFAKQTLSLSTFDPTCICHE